MSDAPGRETTMAEAQMSQAALAEAQRSEAALAEARMGEAAMLTEAQMGEAATLADAVARAATPIETRPVTPALADARQVMAPADAQQVVAMLALPQGPISLELLRLHIASRPACRVIGVVTAAGVPGLEADEMVLLVVSWGAGQWRGTVLCQRAGVAGYVVEGVSVMPEREPGNGDATPLWTYLDYRAVVCAEADGVRRYRVERRDPATEAWRPSEDWQTGLWPDTAGGAIDCLLWLKQKGRL